MYTLGHDFMPPSIHAGGLRYHGDSPIISQLVKAGRMEAVAYPQGKIFEAAIQFANTEGKVPAPETGHAIRAAIDEALAAKETGEEKVILFNYCGHGFLDLAAYDDYLHGRLDRRLTRPTRSAALRDSLWQRCTVASAPETGAGAACGGR